MPLNFSSQIPFFSYVLACRTAICEDENRHGNKILPILCIRLFLGGLFLFVKPFANYFLSTFLYHFHDILRLKSFLFFAKEVSYLTRYNFLSSYLPALPKELQPTTSLTREKIDEKFPLFTCINIFLITFKGLLF